MEGVRFRGSDALVYSSHSRKTDKRATEGLDVRTALVAIASIAAVIQGASAEIPGNDFKTRIVTPEEIAATDLRMSNDSFVSWDQITKDVLREKGSRAACAELDSVIDTFEIDSEMGKHLPCEHFEQIRAAYKEANAMLDSIDCTSSKRKQKKCREKALALIAKVRYQILGIFWANPPALATIKTLKHGDRARKFFKCKPPSRDFFARVPAREARCPPMTCHRRKEGSR